MQIDRSMLAVEVIVARLKVAKIGVVLHGISGIDPGSILELAAKELGRSLKGAVVGYEVSGQRKGVDLKRDIESAVAWRSLPEFAGRIVVFVREDVPKLHSLADLDRISTRDLAHCLIDQCISEPKINEPQRQFWRAIREESPSLALPMLEDFVREVRSSKDSIDSIPKGLWRLGYLRDPAILERRLNASDRLRRNRDLLLEMMQLSESSRQRMSQVLAKSTGREHERLRQAFLALTEYFRRGRREVLQELDFDTVDQLLRAGRPTQAAEREGPTEPRVAMGDAPERSLRGKELAKTIAEIIVTGDETSREGLRELGEIIRSRVESDESSPAEPVVINEGFGGRAVEPQAADRNLVKLLGALCGSGNWGGLIRTKRTEVRDAVRHQEESDIEPFDPENPEQGVLGRSLFELIRQCDRHLSGNPLSEALGRMVVARERLTSFLDLLCVQPFVLFGGYPEARTILEEYVDAYSSLIHRLRVNDSVLHERDERVTRLIAMELLRLDVVHIQGPVEWKAFITPLHPFHLWRFREIFKYLDRFGRELSREEQEQLAAALPGLPHLLHFLVLSQEVTHSDKPTVLPQSGTIELLPTFENHTNRYLGADGIEHLALLLEKWVDYAPYSRIQIRLALIDGPDIHGALSIIREYLLKHSGSSVAVDAYFTRRQNPGGELAQIDYEDGDHEIAELLRLERLTIRLHHVASLDKVAEYINNHPVHISFFFDQTQYSVDHGSRAHQLVVSPLVITHHYSYSDALNRGNISPCSEEEEGIFADYHFVVRRAAHMPPGEQIRLQFGTNVNLSSINSLLTDGGTRWLVVADRALMAYAPKDAIPLGETRVGGREIAVWGGNSSRMVSRLVNLLRRYNLRPDEAKVAELMGKFGHIATGGILSLPLLGGSAEVREASEKGLLGTLVAAAWYSERNPNSLLASLDSTLARQWLQGRSQSSERADLIGLRLGSGGSLIVEPIEVKAASAGTQVTKKRSGEGGGYSLSGLAVDQIWAMLQLLPAIFGGIDTEPLFTPARREALKYQLFRECFRELHNSEWRGEWFRRLEGAFRQPPDFSIECRGLVVHVDFDYQGDITEFFDNESSVRLARIGALCIQRLLVSDLGGDSSAAYEAQNEVQQLDDDLRPSEPLKATERNRDEQSPGSYQGVDVALGNDESEVSEVQELARAFLRAANSYRVRVESCDPARAVGGPTVWRFYVRLSRGQRLDPLRAALEDIGREIRRSGLLVATIPDSDEIALDVPRRSRQYVPLERGLELLETPSSPEEMPIAIGVTPEGQDVVRDLGSMPHMLVGGTTGSGKTMFLYGILLSLLRRHPHGKSLRLLLCTSKPEDFTFFRGLPHLETGDVIDDAERAIELFQSHIPLVFAERLEILTEQQCRDIREYNRKAGEPLPPLVIIVDEFADLADQLTGNRPAREAFYAHLRRVAQLGRSRGIHLVLCTQRPSADLVPTNIRNLMNARVALRVNDSIASRMILDEAGAEQLQMHGDLLFKDQGTLLRAQGYSVSTSDLAENLRQLVSPKPPRGTRRKAVRGSG